MPARTLLSFLTIAFAGSLAAQAAAPAPALPRSTGPFSARSWVIADFNGDGQPDLLTSTLDRWGAGCCHRVDLRIGVETQVYSSFHVSDRGGLNLFAWDVDGDHDLDLIVTNVFSNAPVGVWLNDGAGGFTETPSSAYSAAIWHSFEVSLCSTPPTTNELCALQEERPPAASWSDFPGADAPNVTRQSIVGPERAVSRLFIAPVAPRAPPSLA